MNEQHDSYVSAFYEAIEAEHDFSHAEQILQQMQSHILLRPEYALWSLFFTGILAEERDQDWAMAEQCYQQVLAKNLPVALRATVLLSLGIVYEKMARWQESVDVCEESVALWEELGQQIRHALVLRQIAMSYINGYVSGDFGFEAISIAKSRCSTALTLLQSNHERPGVSLSYDSAQILYTAATWQILGEIYIYLEQYKDAKKCFEKYHAIAIERNDAYRIGFAHWNLADTAHLLGKPHWERAIRLYDSAIESFQSSNDVYSLFKVTASKGVLLQKLYDFDNAMKLYEQSLSMIEGIRKGISSESARIGFFSTVMNVYGKAIQTQMIVKDVPLAFDLFERARSRSFVENLALGTTNSRYLDTVSPITLQDLKSAIREDSLVLEYFTTGQLTANGRSLSGNLLKTSILFPESQTLLVFTSKKRSLSYNVNLNPNALIPSDPHKPVEEYFLDPAIRRALYDKLIAPVADLIKDKRRVYIIPHGPLHYVPFHALIAPDGETLLRVDGPEIVYAPSATILFREMKRAEEPMTGTCLTVGYNGSGESELLFAEGEAQYISTMAEGHALVGPTSKKEELYAQAANYQLVHFSCHGHFDPESPLESALHIAPDEVLTGREIIDNLKLNCDLVTLSACESGLSKVQRGDELYGLIRAFMYAGARAIIASLWRADERTTLIIAERFYQSLQDGASYATALKDAQIFLKNLTRREAVEILGRYLVNEQGDLVVGRNKSGARLTPEIERQAERYLTELRTKGPSSGYEIVPGTDDDDKIFADPWFWAPFVLIGDPQARAGKGWNADDADTADKR